VISMRQSLAPDFTAALMALVSWCCVKGCEPRDIARKVSIGRSAGQATSARGSLLFRETEAQWKFGNGFRAYPVGHGEGRRRSVARAVRSSMEIFRLQNGACLDESRLSKIKSLESHYDVWACHHFLLKTSGRLVVTQPRRQFVSRVHAVQGAVDRRFADGKLAGLLRPSCCRWRPIIVRNQGSGFATTPTRGARRDRCIP
jgi:hypothetical protein